MQLGLPGRDYYLKTSSARDLKAYHRYMVLRIYHLFLHPFSFPFDLFLFILLLFTCCPFRMTNDTRAHIREAVLKEFLPDPLYYLWNGNLVAHVSSSIHISCTRVMRALLVCATLFYDLFSVLNNPTIDSKLDVKCKSNESEYSLEFDSITKAKSDIPLFLHLLLTSLPASLLLCHPSPSSSVKNQSWKFQKWER